MDLKLLGANWNQFGEVDPLWAILMRPDCKEGRWDRHEFFAQGQSDVSCALEAVGWQQIVLRQRRALDFGCGVGRLTQALACYFEEVDGVDIAPSMIRRANRYNPYGERCRFHVNERDELSLFGDGQFDFVLSLIVLQHMRPEYAKKYIAEFLRVLAPGGALVFQMPSHRSQVPLEEHYEPLSLRWQRRAKRRIRTTLKAISSRFTRQPNARSDEMFALVPRIHQQLDPVLEWEDANASEFDDPADDSRYGGGVATRQRMTVAAPVAELYTIERRQMQAYLKRLGGRVLDVQQRSACGPYVHSFTYIVTK